MDEEILKKQANRRKQKVHTILAQSYSMYFLALILGSLFNIFFGIKLFHQPFISGLSFVTLAISSLWILWAQSSTSNFKTEVITEKTFMKGPYRICRNPTNVGLFSLLISFGFILNSLFIILFSLVAFLLSLSFFIKEEERLLATKYGEPYKKYQQIVKF